MSPSHEPAAYAIPFLPFSLQVIGIRLAAPGTMSRFGADVGSPKVLQEIMKAIAALPAGQAHGYHFHFAQSFIGECLFGLCMQLSV